MKVSWVRTPAKSHSHRKPPEKERVYVRNTDTANPGCCYDTVNGDGGFARLEYNVSKAISDYEPIHLNYNMIRKNKNIPNITAECSFMYFTPSHLCSDCDDGSNNVNCIL